MIRSMLKEFTKSSSWQKSLLVAPVLLAGAALVGGQHVHADTTNASGNQQTGQTNQQAQPSNIVTNWQTKGGGDEKPSVKPVNTKPQASVPKVTDEQTVGNNEYDNNVENNVSEDTENSTQTSQQQNPVVKPARKVGLTMNIGATQKRIRIPIDIVTIEGGVPDHHFNLYVNPLVVPGYQPKYGGNLLVSSLVNGNVQAGQPSNSVYQSRILNQVPDQDDNEHGWKISGYNGNPYVIEHGKCTGTVTVHVHVLSNGDTHQNYTQPDDDGTQTLYSHTAFTGSPGSSAGINPNKPHQNNNKYSGGSSTDPSNGQTPANAPSGNESTPSGGGNNDSGGGDTGSGSSQKGGKTAAAGAGAGGAGGAGAGGAATGASTAGGGAAGGGATAGGAAGGANGTAGAIAQGGNGNNNATTAGPNNNDVILPGDTQSDNNNPSNNNVVQETPIVNNNDHAFDDKQATARFQNEVRDDDQLLAIIENLSQTDQKNHNLMMSLINDDSNQSRGRQLDNDEYESNLRAKFSAQNASLAGEVQHAANTQHTHRQMKSLADQFTTQSIVNSYAQAQAIARLESSSQGNSASSNTNTNNTDENSSDVAYWVDPQNWQTSGSSNVMSLSADSPASSSVSDDQTMSSASFSTSSDDLSWLNQYADQLQSDEGGSNNSSQGSQSILGQFDNALNGIVGTPNGKQNNGNVMSQYDQQLKDIIG